MCSTAYGRAIIFRIPESYYRVEDNVAGAETGVEAAALLVCGWRIGRGEDLIAEKCDAYLMHGDPPERVAEKIADLRARRARHKLAPMKFGVAGYAIVRDNRARSSR